jgi:hypothetical protein
MVTMEHKKNPNPLLSKAHLNVKKSNLNNFKMIEAMGLKLLHRGPLEYHYLRTKFHGNLLSSSKVISERQTAILE